MSLEQLADFRNVTLLLRLVTDPDGTLVRGELVDVDGHSLGRFLSWDRLIELLREFTPADRS